MDWSKFLAILQMVPVIIAMVHKVEEVIPGQGQGAKKLDLVLGAVGAAADAVPTIHQEITKNDLLAATTGIVNTTVKVLNEAGVFTK